MDIQTLIHAKFSGQLSETTVYTNLAIQAIAVIIAGIVLWRISTGYHLNKQRKRKEAREKNSPFSRRWSN